MTFPPHVATLCFSTTHLAEAQRLSAARDLFDQSVQLDLKAERGQPVDMEILNAPGLRRARMVSSFTARLARSAQRLRDGEDTVCLMIKTGGSMAVTQGRSLGIPGLGDAGLLVYRRPALLEFKDATYIAVRVPLAALAGMADVEAAAGCQISAHNEALRLLRAYVTNLPDLFHDERVGQLAVTHVYDLMALAIGTTKSGHDLAVHRGARAARLHAIKASLVRDPTQAIGRLASEHGISERYVQMLFEEDGTTFSQFALQRRLETARHLLLSPRYRSWTIAAVAMEAGFNDLSHFNRRFKQRYLMTPKDLRAGTRNERPDTNSTSGHKDAFDPR